MIEPVSRFRDRLLPKGTPVIAAGKYEGVVDASTVNGDYVVKFYSAVKFPTLGVKVERASFCPAMVKELK